MGAQEVLASDRYVGTGSIPFVRVAGRELRPTQVFDTYWRFAAARQAVYEARLSGQSPPWSGDPVLAAYRFTNCYRAADRVSQYLITQVCYRGDQSWDEVFFRVLLFKIFNRVGTWRLLTAQLNEVMWAEYDSAAFESILGGALMAGERLYSAAYIMPPPPLGEARKHSNHLRLLEAMMKDRAPEKVRDAPSMSAAFSVLAGYPGVGSFLAYQYLIDLNYAAELGFSEMDFVVPGPGAKDGIRKCFGAAAGGIESEVIRYMADAQDEHFTRLGLRFRGLRGRPLQLIDCQNLFCEVDKYARVAHPDVPGISGRTRIKQAYRRDSEPVSAWFPPKWGLNQAEPPLETPSLDASMRRLPGRRPAGQAAHGRHTQLAMF
jgi:alpha-glutamyl/putrescinyl thymine pyrophosphorylase clade 1